MRNSKCPFCKSLIGSCEIDTHLESCIKTLTAKRLDEAKANIAICANPECKSPRFIKARSTQKYCFDPECRTYEKNQAALKWWNSTGKDRRWGSRSK
jgi:hypothetical protein